jgi:rSAM/selenodomain-associated transferase 2
MQAAIQSAVSKSRGPALLLGTDIPDLTANHLVQAFDALTDHDLVLGPSPDGGYWLVGCRKPVDIFKYIPWGTSRVLASTLAAAGRQGLKVKQLAPLNDIDTPQDLIAWQLHSARPMPYLSIIIPTLNEAHCIADVIARVQGADIEVLVADGGSRDATVAIARRAGARVISTPPGRAIQQNQAAARATGGVLLFLHADTRLPKNFGRFIFDCLLDRHVAVGAFRFKTDLNHWGMTWIEKWAHLRSKLLQMPYGDQALFMPRAVFDRVGGFPLTPIAEDLQLVHRLAKLGSVRIVSAAAVTSARRWQRVGLVRTTVINHLIAIGCLLHIDPRRLAPLYKGKRAKRDVR